MIEIIIGALMASLLGWGILVAIKTLRESVADDDGREKSESISEPSPSENGASQRSGNTDAKLGPPAGSNSEPSITGDGASQRSDTTDAKPEPIGDNNTETAAQPIDTTQNPFDIQSEINQRIQQAGLDLDRAQQQYRDGNSKTAIDTVEQAGNELIEARKGLDTLRARVNSPEFDDDLDLDTISNDLQEADDRRYQVRLDIPKNKSETPIDQRAPVQSHPAEANESDSGESDRVDTGAETVERAINNAHKLNAVLGRQAVQNLETAIAELQQSATHRQNGEFPAAWGAVAHACQVMNEATTMAAFVTCQQSEGEVVFPCYDESIREIANSLAIVFDREGDEIKNAQSNQLIQQTESLLAKSPDQTDPSEVRDFLTILEDQREALTRRIELPPPRRHNHDAVEQTRDQLDQVYANEVTAQVETAQTTMTSLRSDIKAYVRSSGEPSDERLERLQTRAKAVQSEFAWLTSVPKHGLLNQENKKQVRTLREEFGSLDDAIATALRVREAFCQHRRNLLLADLREAWLEKRDSFLADLMALVTWNTALFSDTVVTYLSTIPTTEDENVLAGWNGPAVGIFEQGATINCPVCGSECVNAAEFLSHRIRQSSCPTDSLFEGSFEQLQGDTKELLTQEAMPTLQSQLEETGSSVEETIKRVRSEAEQRGFDAIFEATEEIETEVQCVTSLVESQLRYHSHIREDDFTTADRLGSDIRADYELLSSSPFLLEQTDSGEEINAVLKEELRSQLLSVTLITTVDFTELSKSVSAGDFKTAMDTIDRQHSQVTQVIIQKEFQTILKIIYGLIAQERLSRTESKLNAIADMTSPEFPRHDDTGATRPEYNRYLTQHSYDRYSTELAALEDSIKTVNKSIDRALLTDQDIGGIGASAISDYVHQIGKGIRWYQNLLANREQQNREFVQRQAAACESLFSDVGSENLTLDENQRKAVIRNETYNQVIAAAGTGKTMTLAARVDYLIHELNIDPQRILLLSFGGDAKEEMTERLKDDFGIENVSVQTVHSYGNGVIGSTQGPSPDVLEPGKFDDFVDNIISGESEHINAAFIDHFERYLEIRDDEQTVTEDFDDKETYYQAKRAQRYSTLDNETVKSVAERRIANFLFRHQIEYRYEARAEWVETGEDYGTYTPDFYLPKYDIYIEHWGVDKQGEVAPWFSETSEEYRATAQWKREQFAQTGEYALIETHEFERVSGTLETVLSAHLDRLGVAMDRLEYTELVEETFDRYELKRIKKQLKRFIDLAKTFRLDHDHIQANIENMAPDKQAFGAAGLALLKQYETHLNEIDHIDFTDMVNGAIDAIDTGQVQAAQEFDHVLVDEFQDLGDNQLELIDRITGPDSGRLFCVGDDWQSIYSFNGADVDRFIDFEEYFGDAARTRLTSNYRCPETIVTAGNDLIQANEQQVEKEVSSNAGIDTTPLLHELDGSEYTAYDHTLRDYVRKLVRTYLDQGASPGEIRILCRYEAGPYLDVIREGLRTLGVPFKSNGSDFIPKDPYDGFDNEIDGQVSISTVHKSKGTEARHVILVHAVEGDLGFPAVNQTGDLLAPVRPVAIDSLAEERRLFYVALTRSSGTLDLLTRSEKESRFIDEIQQYIQSAWAGNSIAQTRNSNSQTELIAKLKKNRPHSHPSIHQRGVLEDLTGAVDFVTLADIKEKVEIREWYEFTRIYSGTYNGRPQLEVKPDTLFRSCDDPSMPVGEITAQKD